MKDPPAHGLDTTFEFLKSPGGVRQALYVDSSHFLSQIPERVAY